MEKQFRYDFQTAVVETDKGLVHGYEYDGMSIFKGIPYARSKRFHDPEPVEPWDGLREATGYGYVCPLLDEERLDSFRPTVQISPSSSITQSWFLLPRRPVSPNGWKRRYSIR